jgi:hypothetical protein
MGDGRSAATEFQKLLDHRGLVWRDVIGVLSYLQVARAQKLMGDDAAAHKWYEDFLTLWKDADPRFQSTVKPTPSMPGWLRIRRIVQISP